MLVKTQEKLNSKQTVLFTTAQLLNKPVGQLNINSRNNYQKSKLFMNTQRSISANNSRSGNNQIHETGKSKISFSATNEKDDNLENIRLWKKQNIDWTNYEAPQRFDEGYQTGSYIQKKSVSQTDFIQAAPKGQMNPSQQQIGKMEVPQFGKQVHSQIFSKPPALSNAATFQHKRDEKLIKPQKKEVLPVKEDTKSSYIMNASVEDEFKVSNDPKLFNKQLMAFYVDFYLMFEKENILKQLELNSNFQPQFDLCLFKKVCKITSEGSDPYQDLNPMKNIQDATIVYEIETIFDEKLKEFYPQAKTSRKQIPQSLNGSIFLVQDYLEQSPQLESAINSSNEEFKPQRDNFNLTEKLKEFKEEFVQIPDSFKEKYQKHDMLIRLYFQYFQAELMMKNSFMDRYFSGKKLEDEEKRKYFNVDLFLSYAKTLSEDAASFLRYKEEKEMKTYLQNQWHAFIKGQMSLA